MRFDVIVADPPWWYNPRKNVKKIPGKSWFGGGAPGQYTCMSDDELLDCDLAVRLVAADNCALFLWYPLPRQPFAHEVLESWGFRFATVAFTWTKISKAGKPITGPGYYTGSNEENVLLGVRGSMPPARKLVPPTVWALRGKHSQKPEEVQNRIERMYPTAKKLEMFATRERPGWTCVGDAISGKDIREDLEWLSKE